MTKHNQKIEEYIIYGIRHKPDTVCLIGRTHSVEKMKRETIPERFNTEKVYATFSYGYWSDFLRKYGPLSLPFSLIKENGMPKAEETSLKEWFPEDCLE